MSEGAEAPSTVLLGAAAMGVMAVSVTVELRLSPLLFLFLPSSLLTLRSELRLLCSSWYFSEVKVAAVAVFALAARAGVFGDEAAGESERGDEVVGAAFSLFALMDASTLVAAGVGAAAADCGSAAESTTSPSFVSSFFSPSLRLRVGASASSLSLRKLREDEEEEEEEARGLSP